MGVLQGTLGQELFSTIALLHHHEKQLEGFGCQTSHGLELQQVTLLRLCLVQHRDVWTTRRAPTISVATNQHKTPEPRHLWPPKLLRQTNTPAPRLRIDLDFDVYRCTKRTMDTMDAVWVRSTSWVKESHQNKREKTPEASPVLWVFSLSAPHGFAMICRLPALCRLPSNGFED